MTTKAKKEDIIKKFGKEATDTGKAEVQVALLTERINELTEHLDRHKKDNSSRRGLIKLVSKRRKILSYLSKTDISRYRQVLAQLSLRK